MDVSITKIVTEYTLDIEPTVVLTGTYYADGSFHGRRQVVTSAKVRVTAGETPYIQLFGSDLNADGTRSKRSKGETWIGSQQLIRRGLTRDEDTFSSETTDAIEAAVLQAVEEAAS